MGYNNINRKLRILRFQLHMTTSGMSLSAENEIKFLQLCRNKPFIHNESTCLRNDLYCVRWGTLLTHSLNSHSLQHLYMCHLPSFLQATLQKKQADYNCLLKIQLNSTHKTPDREQKSTYTLARFIPSCSAAIVTNFS